ncbi:MAG: dTMP kinase [Blastocatellia bacterium]|nr:dTMP kinase [Blastocatellia bacterium]
MSGLFITFEGIDGSGKTTQLQKLSSWLAGASIPHLVTKEPGGTVIGREIRQILLSSSSSNIVPTAELLLYAADRAQHVQQVLLPELRAGKVVLSDRYTDATVAYQGYGRLLPLETIKELNSIATGGLVPNLTLLFDLEVEKAQLRLKRSREIDRLESEFYDFHERVRYGYLELARKDSRFVLIAANSSQEEIFEQVLSAVKPFLF